MNTTVITDGGADSSSQWIGFGIIIVLQLVGIAKDYMAHVKRSSCCGGSLEMKTDLARSQSSVLPPKSSV